MGYCLESSRMGYPDLRRNAEYGAEPHGSIGAQRVAHWSTFSWFSESSTK